MYFFLKELVEISDAEFLKWRGMVVSIAIKYISALALDGATMDDIIQIGSIGLLYAYNSYDESKGVRATYYYMCIKHQILESIKRTTYQKRKANINSISTQSTVMLPSGGTSILEDTLEDNIDIEAEVIDKLLSEQMLQEFKSILKEKEYNIFYLKAMEQYTFQQIANIYKCSRQAIEQSYKRVKAKLIQKSKLLKEVTIENYFKKLSALENGSSAYKTTPETYVLAKMNITDNLAKRFY